MTRTRGKKRYAADAWWRMLSRVLRRTRGTRRLIAILPTVVALGLGACSSDDNEPARGSAGTTASTAADGQPEIQLPGDRPQAYAIYVDERDIVWISDFGANAIVRFDPQTEEFTEFPLPSPNGSVRQLLGRPGEVWGAESSVDKLIVIRTG